MRLEQYGWNEYFENSFYSLAAPGESPGRVCAENRGVCRVITEGGDFDAELTGRFQHNVARRDRPAVGDWVVLRGQPGRIDGVLPRRTAISRKQAGAVTEEQILSANVDVVFLVTSLDGDFNLRHLERYLLVVREGGAEPVIVLNKADRAGADQAVMAIQMILNFRQDAEWRPAVLRSVAGSLRKQSRGSQCIGRPRATERRS